MKQKRKFLQMLDVRVRQSMAGYKLTQSGSLSRVHSIESLATDHSDFKVYSPAATTTVASSS